jgi:hypothetical protein
LHCGEQTAPTVLQDFERAGVAGLQEQSGRPHQDYRGFHQPGWKRREAMVDRSPGDFGMTTRLGRLPGLAQVGFQQPIVAAPISDETGRRDLLKVGIDWQPAGPQITRQDPQDERQKAG